MNKKLMKWESWGVVIIFIMQGILHFAYEFTGFKAFALISAVNESVWEHLKIGFYGALLFYIIEYLVIGKSYTNFIFAKLMSLYFIPLFILTSFYTYTGIFGHHYLWVDLLIAFSSGLFGQFISYKIIVSKKNYRSLNTISVFLLLLAILAFTFFTFKPAQLPLFYDKTNNKYGM